MTTGVYDPFRPSCSVERAIYEAFLAEASKRRERPGLTWIDLERVAVLEAACAQARLQGWPSPTLVEVKRAEMLARGHCDYGSKWARSIVDAMRPRMGPRCSVLHPAREVA